MSSVPPPRDAAAAQGDRVHALVVDDVPGICDFFQRLFRRLGFLHVSLVTATGAPDAIARLRAERYDLVLSDFRLGDGDGLRVLAEARERNPACVRLLMSGYDEIPADVARLRQAGVDGFLTKPLDPAELSPLLIGILGGRAEATLAPLRQRAAAALAAAEAAGDEAGALG